MMRISLIAGLLAGMLAAGCRVAATKTAAHKEAVRTNALSNKHILTESPTLERPAPKPAPGP